VSGVLILSFCSSSIRALDIKTSPHFATSEGAHDKFRSPRYILSDQTGNRSFNPAPTGNSRSIVQKLLDRNGTLTLALQKELIEDRKCLQETQAGKAVADRLKLEIRRVKQEEKALRRTVPKDDLERVSLQIQLANLKVELKTWEKCRDTRDDLEAWPERVKKKKFFGR
jgi:hypothetical protein